MPLESGAVFRDTPEGKIMAITVNNRITEIPIKRWNNITDLRDFFAESTVDFDRLVERLERDFSIDEKFDNDMLVRLMEEKMQAMGERLSAASEIQRQST